MHPEDRHVQRIVYREAPDRPLQDFKLCTVTYGTKSASFLATRCLLQLAQDTYYSSVKRTIVEDFYVDHLMSGGATDDHCTPNHEHSTPCTKHLVTFFNLLAFHFESGAPIQPV